MAWWPLGKIQIDSGRLWVGDGQFAPDADDGQVIDVTPGTYEVAIDEVMVGQGANRIRAVLEGANPQVAKEIGTSWADTGCHGVCDQVAVAAIAATFDGGFHDLFMDAYEKGKPGVFHFDPENKVGMAWSFIDGGDGDYRVYELTENGQRCGIEVEFRSPELQD
jgi:hypothetical protein